MADELRFDDKVVIITGAGGGLGRAHALMFGSRGAKVVVNDLGGGMHGAGASSKMADVVVAEIKEAGGEAVANYDSVEDGDKIVQTALDTYGRIDVVVNNAGILRDTSFHKMKEEDWDLIYRVHVLGSFKVTHAAWPHMREQGYGRIVMTGSAAGIYGNFGQANYGMAKLGLTGLANTLAIEGGRKDIHVNTIAPIAGSRLTETVLPAELIEALKPEYVSPLVLWLCHEQCQDNGGLFELGGGFFSKLRWERTIGHTVRLGREITPELMRREWDKITDFSDATHSPSIAQSMSPIMDNVQAGPSKGGNDLIDVDQALGYEYPERTTSYDERDLAIYALGVGAASDPLDDNELKLVYEMHSEGFVALPTYGVIPAVNTLMTLAKEGITAPGLNYGLDRLLHGEQYTEVMRPLPSKGKLTHRARVKDIWDKGKGAIVNTETKSYDENGELLVVNELVAFVRGAGGWGGDSGPSSDINTPPKRGPDTVTEEKIGDNQALLYRLSGDWNPLHVDPNFAKAFGFEKPILHGLCAFGYAGRHIINAYAKGDPRYFKSIKVRFAKTVLPGETLVTEMWKESDTRVLFRCKVKERDEEVITHAALELYSEIPKPKPKAAPKQVAAAAAAPTEPISADIFTAIGTFLAAKPDTAAQIGKIFQFKLTGPDSLWTVDLKSGGGSVGEGEVSKPDCSLELTDANFMAMCTGKADAQKLYFSGDLKISGDIMASQKLTFLKKIEPQMVVDAMNARGGGAAATAPAEAAPTEPISADIFTAIGTFLAANPDTAAQIGKIFQFKLTGPDSLWTVDLKSGGGSVGEGEVTKPDCSLELTDANFMAMCTGKADAQKLYFSGDLKISGDIMASQKLTFLKKIEPQMVVDAMNARGGAGATSAPAAASGPASGDVFLGIKAYVAEHPELADEVNKVFQFRLTEPDSVWTVDVKNDGGSVEPGDSSKPDCTLEITDSDFMDMTSGKADAQKLYFSGKLKIKGDIMASQKLTFLQKIDPDWARDKVAQLKAEGAAPAAAAAAAPSANKEAAAPKIIEALSKRIADTPGLIADVKATIALKVGDDGWTINLKDAKGTVTAGVSGEVDATLTISDEDLAALCAGEASAQDHFQRGKLVVDGDVKVAQRLSFLNNLV